MLHKGETAMSTQIKTAIISFNTSTTTLVNVEYNKPFTVKSIEIRGNLYIADKTTIEMSNYKKDYYGKFQIYPDWTTKFLKITPSYGSSRVGKLIIVYEGDDIIDNAYVGTTVEERDFQVDVVNALASGTNPIGYVRGTREKLMASPWTDTTTTLSANTSYTGTSRDRQIDSTNYEYYAYFMAEAIADVSGTLIIQESPDGSTWVTVASVATQAVTNPDGTTMQVARIIHKCIYRYVRVAYRNGATAQTSFRLASALGTVV
jgi:hypothetical protein